MFGALFYYFPLFWVFASHCMLMFLSLPDKTKVQMQRVTVDHAVDLAVLEK